MSDTERESSPAAVPILDRAAAVARMDGDVRVFYELAGMFIERCPTIVQGIRDAIDQRNGEGLYHAAHSLEGSLATFYAEAASIPTKALEEIGRQQNWDEAGTQMARLNTELSRLASALRLMIDRDSG